MGVTQQLANTMKQEAEFKVAEIEVSYTPSNIPNQRITDSTDVVQYLKPFYNNMTIALQEEFLVVYLNNAGAILGIYRHSKGAMNATIVDVRLIMATGLKTGAHQIILSHNHPSGRLQPSQNDQYLTRKVKEAGILLDIKLLDHIIVDAAFNIFSFASDGLL
jgi:DNA repair protein RadC